MEVSEGGGDVLPVFGPGEYSSSRVLDVLQSVQGLVGESEQDTIAEGLCDRIWE